MMTERAEQYWSNGRRKPYIVQLWESLDSDVEIELVEILEGLNLDEEFERLRDEMIIFFKPFLTSEVVNQFKIVTTKRQFVTYPNGQDEVGAKRHHFYAAAHVDWEPIFYNDGSYDVETIVSFNRGRIVGTKAKPPDNMNGQEAAQLFIRESIAHELVHTLLTANGVSHSDQALIEGTIDTYARIIVNGVEDKLNIGDTNRMVQ